MRQSQAGWGGMVATTVAALTVQSALGVVINNGTAANATAPADDPGWANVGQLNGASGVYLGHFATGDWVLTASHVGAGNINLGGVSYATVSGSAVQLTNPDGSPTDLELFRISSNPTLPNLTLADTSPTIGSIVMMVGYGSTGAATLTTWDTSTSPWTATTSPTAPHAQGYLYETGSRYTKRWGEDVVTGDFAVSYANGNVQVTTVALETTFTAAAGSSELAPGDSGGATFIKVGGQWELAGINLAIGTLADQGQPSGTAVFDNTSYMGDLAAYRGQIGQVTGSVPEPAPVALLLLGAAALGFRRR